MNRKYRMIAIDGPAGSGKSTTARVVAKRLGFTYLDTGALYRAVTYLALQRGIDLQDGPALAKVACEADFRIETEPDQCRVWVDDIEVTDQIRSPAVTNAVSLVAGHHEVRQELVALQRRIAKEGNFVVEGRDIGTVVFPGADLKIFLEASLVARTTRRLRELQEMGVEIGFEALQEEIANRDNYDRQRKTSPLRIADDAMIIDTTALSVEEQVNKIVHAYRSLE